MMQADGTAEKIRSVYRHVDVVFGTFNLHEFPALLEKKLTTGKKVFEILDSHGAIPDISEAARNVKHKASVDIIYGCDNFCSYCVVPYVRGREKSREPRFVIEEVKRLAYDGVVEIMLLGQNVNSYGRDLSPGIKTDFASLLYELNKIKDIKRIRFMTSNPKDLTDDLIRAVAECGSVCKHIHLPLQSGSSRILKKMNRKYAKEDYLALADKIKKIIPGVGVTTDIIVGFPGETEEDFLETLDIVSRVKFLNAFTFIYSPRRSTPAYEMDCVDAETVSGRFNRLLLLLNDEINKINSGRVGKILPVLADEANRGSGLLTGRADDNTLVHFEGGAELIGKITDVTITENKIFYLLGTTAKRG